MTMTDVGGPAPSGSADTLGRPDPRRRVSERRDTAVRVGVAVAGLVPGVALVALAVVLLVEAWPSIVFNGVDFFGSPVFSTGSAYATDTVTRNGYQAVSGSSFGILALLVGTVLSSAIAVVVAVPIAVGGAILLAERVPARLQGPLGVFLELLAGIPSVVFGLWGIATFGPALARYVYYPIASLGLPWLSRGVAATGQGLLTSSLVLAVMIVPIIAATTRELVRSVPATTREAASGLGLTASESVRVVTWPFVRSGVLAAALLGLGRALGETIAVLLISGFNLNGFPASLFAPFATMAASIAAFLDSALQDPTGMAVSALAEIGLVLLIVTVASNFAGRAIVRRSVSGGLPVGRGI